MGTLRPASHVVGNRFAIGDKAADLIGSGAMGDVYRGRDLLTDQWVAIKALKPEVVDPTGEMVIRFIREGEALRQLNHPNIVALIDMVKEEDASLNGHVYFLVMEYVDGGSLRQLLIKEGQLSAAQVLEIGLDLADALTRAHRLGIIHRDLKPGNVLIAADGTPRLTDFGLAQMSASSSLTQAGALIGTVDYISPEACNGQSLDERTDIWSFGVVLWEMLAGWPPFRRDNLGATLAAILTDEPADVRHYCPELADNFVHLLDLMLAKDPYRRIPSMRLVGAELESILLNRESALSTAWQQPGRADGRQEVVDTWSALQAMQLVLAHSREQGDQILGQPSLTFAYSVRQELELDDEGAALMLRSALFHGESFEPWLASFASKEQATGALKAYYDTNPQAEVRLRIVEALARLADETADMVLIHIAAHDEATSVRSAAALHGGRRGYQDVMMSQTLAQVQEGADPASLAILAVLVDEHGLPEDSSLYLKLQVTLALAKRRWRRYRGAVWRQARRVGLYGMLMAIYGASIPFLMYRTDPQGYQSGVERAGLPIWMILLIVFFALFGLLQGLACGFFTGLADAIWIGGPRRLGRLFWSSPAGLVYALIISLFVGLQPEGAPSSPAVYVPVTLLMGLIVGMLLSLAIPPLGRTRTRSRQFRRMILISLIAVAVNIPYMILVIPDLEPYVTLSRSLFMALLPLVIGLPFLAGQGSVAGVKATDDRLLDEVWSN